MPGAEEDVMRWIRRRGEETLPGRLIMNRNTAEGGDCERRGEWSADNCHLPCRIVVKKTSQRDERTDTTNSGVNDKGFTAA
jgi:hypothetical protein